MLRLNPTGASAPVRNPVRPVYPAPRPPSASNSGFYGTVEKVAGPLGIVADGVKFVANRQAVRNEARLAGSLETLTRSWVGAADARIQFGPNNAFTKSMEALHAQVMTETNTLRVSAAKPRALTNFADFAGKAFDFVEAGAAGINAYQTSKANTTIGRVGEGAFESGITLLSSSHPILNAFDFVTGGAYKDTVRAGGHAILGIGSYIAGDRNAAVEFRQRSLSGEYGWAPQAISLGTDYTTQAVADSTSWLGAQAGSAWESVMDWF